ncbi:TBC1 domain family member 9B-like [Ochotona curzoniae]|uniref:TBC1 domain family member 9B-like n=1 Tax=Ochotona curzoniae TaxID=130825 RepID=UPI001B352285|nr:TBC1 domain family member 9B-like [Ochotona curzoniae]
MRTHDPRGSVLLMGNCRVRPVRLRSHLLNGCLDNVVNEQSTSPPVPHLHALLTSGDEPPTQTDIFDLLKASYEKFSSLRASDIEQMRFKQRLKVIQSLEDTAKRSVVRAIPGDTGFSIEELEDLYMVFKVRAENRDRTCGMYHGDMTEKLKVLYKLHLPPGEHVPPHPWIGRLVVLWKKKTKKQTRSGIQLLLLSVIKWGNAQALLDGGAGGQSPGSGQSRRLRAGNQNPGLLPHKHRLDLGRGGLQSQLEKNVLHVVISWLAEALPQEDREGSRSEDTQEKRAEEKGTSPPDYRHYLRMWAKEREAQKETIKDLPKMNQEQFIELCKTLYNKFSEDPLEQDLYHAIATVASLLRISEVGKFFSPSVKKPTGGTPSRDQGSSTEDESPLPSPARESHQDPVQECQLTATGDPWTKAGGDTHLGKVPQERQTVVEGGSGEGQGSPSQLLSDDETKYNISMSSYSVVSMGSLQCENPTATARIGNTMDADWCISFKQILASILPESVLVNFFEKRVDIGLKMKDQKKVERQLSASSEHEPSVALG